VHSSLLISKMESILRDCDRRKAAEIRAIMDIFESDRDETKLFANLHRKCNTHRTSNSSSDRVSMASNNSTHNHATASSNNSMPSHTTPSKNSTHSHANASGSSTPSNMTARRLAQAGVEEDVGVNDIVDEGADKEPASSASAASSVSVTCGQAGIAQLEDIIDEQHACSAERTSGNWYRLFPPIDVNQLDEYLPYFEGDPGPNNELLWNFLRWERGLAPLRKVLSDD